MSATDTIRAMLDERGVEWSATDTYRLLVTSWNDASGHSWAFMEHRDGSFSKLTAYHLTPEQAIEATLGRGTCRMEKRHMDWRCTGCGEIVGTDDPTSELFIDGNAVELWRYCPNCGRKVRA